MSHLQEHVVRSTRCDVRFENEARDNLEMIRIKDAIYHAAEVGQKPMLGKGW